MARYLPGDIVSRRKGFVMHKGVVMEDGRILHNTPFRGEHLATEQEFRASKRLYVNSVRPEHRREVLRRARAQHSRDYNLFTNNCEHTTHRVVDGEAHSPQLRSWISGVGLAGVAFAVTRHPGITAAAYALGRSVFRRSNRR